jgi:uncharacterized protein YcbK (DUF882 family)
MLPRRKLLRLGLAAVAGSGLCAAANGLASAATTVAQPLPLAANAPRKVAFHNLHTGEKLSAVYFEKGRYAPDVMNAVNHLLRDYRTGDVHMIDPRLLDLLDAVAQRTGSRDPFEVICGYRSPKTNAMLHARSEQVAAHSLHLKGQAIDIRLNDQALPHLHAAALKLGAGGVGYYPVSNFVHVDVGPVRRWQGA